MNKYLRMTFSVVATLLLLLPLAQTVSAKAPSKTQFAKDIKKTIRTAESKTSETIYRSEIMPGKYKPFSKIEPTLKKYYTAKYIKKWKTVYNKVGDNLYVLSEPFFPFRDHEYAYSNLKAVNVNYESAFRVKSLTTTKATLEIDVPPLFIEDSYTSYTATYKLIKVKGKWLLDEKTWKRQKVSKFKKFVNSKNLSKIVLKQVGIKNSEVKSYSYYAGVYTVKIGQKGNPYGYYFEDVSPYTGTIIPEDY